MADGLQPQNNRPGDLPPQNAGSANTPPANFSVHNMAPSAGIPASAPVPSSTAQPQISQQTPPPINTEVTSPGLATAPPVLNTAPATNPTPASIQPQSPASTPQSKPAADALIPASGQPASAVNSPTKIKKIVLIFAVVLTVAIAASAYFLMHKKSNSAVNSQEEIDSNTENRANQNSSSISPGSTSQKNNNSSSSGGGSNSSSSPNVNSANGSNSNSGSSGVAPVSNIDEWRTYSNTSFKYSIKYPNDWTVQDLTADMHDSTILSYISFSPKNASVFAMFISVEKNSLNSLIEKLKSQFQKNGTLKSQTEVIFAGASATKIIFSDNRNSSLSPTYYLVPKNDNIVVISGNGINGAEDIEASIGAMLNSFSFIN